MPGGLGMMGYVGLARESSGGTAVAVNQYIQALSESLKVDLDRYDTINISGVITEPDDEAGVVRIAGDIVAAFDPLVGGHFLRGVVGSASVTSLGGSHWRHSFKPPTVSQWDQLYALQPYTIEVHRDVGSAQAYFGCNFNRLELNMAPNQALQMTVGVIGTGFTNRAVSTASYSGVHPFVFNNTSVAIGGVADADIEAFTFITDNALEGVPTLNNTNRIRKIRRSGYTAARLNFTMSFEDITELEAFVAQTERAMNFSVRQGSAQLNIICPRIVYEAYPTGIGGRGRQTVEVSARAFYHTGSLTTFEIQLTSPVGSY